MPQLSALLQTFALYFAMTVSFLGWGKAARTVLKTGELPSDSVATDIWIGWAASLALLQFLHLFLPLGAGVAVSVFSAGIALSIRYRGCAVKWRRYVTGAPGIIGSAVFLVSAAWIATRSMQTPLEFDGGLYHFSAVRWINEFRIIPGLGNLHGRLAFNSSFFTYVAALNFYPFFGHGRSIANGYLFLVLLGQILGRLCPAISNPGALTENHGLSRAGDLLVLPLLGYCAMTSLGFASPSADLASTLLQIAIFLFLVHGIGECAAGVGNMQARIFALMVLAATTVTIKTSNVGFAAGIATLCVAECAQKRPRPLSGSADGRDDAPLLHGAMKNACLASTFILAVWIARGYILSGYPFYPLPFGRVPFDWAVQPDQARYDSDVIICWAREPWFRPGLVMGNWHWLHNWSRRASMNIEEIVYPVSIFLAASLVSSIIYFRKERKPGVSRLADWIFVVPVVTGLIFWFLTAPNLRFSNALIWLLAVASALGLICMVDRYLRRYMGAALIVAVALACNGCLAYWVATHAHSLREISHTGWEPVLESRFAPRTTLTGLRVYTYKAAVDGLIWEGPIPATPELNPHLSLRVPGKPEFGFMLR